MLSIGSLRRVNIGCGHDKRAGFLNVDIDPDCHPDVLLADHDLSALPQGHFEEVLAWDVLEHIPHAFTMSALLDWAALLKPDGRLTLQTSSVFGVIDTMRLSPSFETEFNWMRCLFGNQAHRGDFHHVGFTERTLRVFLSAAGFEISEFRLADGWLFQCAAVRRRDWTELLRLPPEAALKGAYLDWLGRELPGETLDSYLGNLAAGLPLRSLVMQIAGAPERLYKLGAALDREPLRLGASPG